MVPRDQLHRIRASLAEAGVAATPNVQGYELLDSQALGVSDFRQRVDLQRAWEGELVRTLTAMDAIDAATVRLVIPEDGLFTEQRHPATASVLVRTRHQIDSHQIEAITLLVSSAVEGLEPGNVAITDTDGRMLHSPGDGAIAGSTDRHQRRTREFEDSLAADLVQLLQRATNAPATAIVRARLDFSESEIHTESYEPDTVTLREHTSSERSEGSMAQPPAGTAGIDGAPITPETNDGTWERDEAIREFGAARTTTRTVRAPGGVEQLHVAVVVDEGASVADDHLHDLIAAAAGIELQRGDQIAITRAASPAAADPLPFDERLDPFDLAQRIIALVTLVAIVITFIVMARRARRGGERVVPGYVRNQQSLAAGPEEPTEPDGPTPRDDVVALVERQPDEIAALLRSWLADRRTRP